MNLLLFPDKQLRAGSWQEELGAFSRALKVGTVLIVHTEMYKNSTGTRKPHLYLLGEQGTKG